MTPLEWARFLRQANSLVGFLTGAGLCMTDRPVLGVFFILAGMAHLWAEIRRWPYRVQDVVLLGIALMLNLFVMSAAFLQLWTS